MPCRLCQGKAAIKYAADGTLLCKECFFQVFEDRVRDTIVEEKLFTSGQTVAVCVSGGKDSSVLTHVLHLLNDRCGLGIHLRLVAIDEGISGYRDDSLACVYRMRDVYELPLMVRSFKELFGTSLDELAAQQPDSTAMCSDCGVLRRKALIEGARASGCDLMALGHNADDAAEAVLLNLMRGDAARLGRYRGAVTTGGDVPRVKPMHHCMQRDIVMYAHLRRLDYFATECTYATRAFRNVPRAVLAAAGTRAQGVPLRIMEAADSMAGRLATGTRPGVCGRCGGMASGRMCQACVVTEQGDKRARVG